MSLVPGRCQHAHALYIGVPTLQATVGQAAAEHYPPGYGLKPVPSAQAKLADDADYPPGYAPKAVPFAQDYCADDADAPPGYSLKYTPSAVAMQVIYLVLHTANRTHHVCVTMQACYD